MTYEELVNSGKSIGNMTNDELITYCSGLLDEIWEYDKRFDRAIEYIENNWIEYSDFQYVDNDDELNIDCESIKELIDILKGEKDERI